MFLPLLCLGTILAPTCPASCQPSCSPPPSSGSIVPAWLQDEVVTVSRLKACMAVDATPGSLRHRDRPPGSHPGSPAATKWVSFSDLLVSLPFPPAPPRDGPRTVFLPGEEVFARPGTNCAFTDAVPIPSMGTATEVGPLTSSPPS
jgi:hypothetical protein